MWTKVKWHVFMAHGVYFSDINYIREILKLWLI